MNPTVQIFSYGADFWECSINMGSGRTLVAAGDSAEEAARKALEQLVSYVHTLEDELAKLEDAS